MLARLAACALVVLVLAACGPSRPIPPVRRPTSDSVRSTDFDADQRARLARLHATLAEPVAPELSRGLLVRLAFDGAADLDLFVTDPMQESVYFGNSPTRSGGELIADRRCDDRPPRVEVVHFPEPVAGRYRVGVDFHRRCQETSPLGGAGNEGLYLVRVDEAARVLEREGMLTPGRFEVIVIEFDVESRRSRSSR